jgi:iron(III) transport system permease protein
VLALERATRGRSRYADASLRARSVQRLPLMGLRAGLAVVACALPLLLGFVLPALVLTHLAASTELLPLRRLATLAGNSVLVAALTAAAAVAVALLIAYAARAQRGSLMRAAHRVAGFGYALPGSVIAVGVLIPVTRVDHALAAALRSGLGIDPGLIFTGGIAALVYACLVRYLTAALQSVDAGLARITPSMDHASRSLGLTAGETLARVHLPLLRGSVLTAALLVFIDVMKELPATLVMRPFNFDTLATTAYTLASDERLAEAATPALAIVAVGLGPMVLLCRRIARGAAAPHV